MMKKWMTLGLMLASVTAFSATGKKVTLKIDGMTCSSCAKKIEKNLKALPEVSSAHVDVEKGKAEVVLKEGKTLEPSALEATVKKAGYEAKALQ